MIHIPIRTVSALNAREHWRARARRVKHERQATALFLRQEGVRPLLPCSVHLTRIAPSNGLDSDNLPGAVKGVRDQIADWLGVDDKRADLVSYHYAQERGPWGVRVEFKPAEVVHD
jgi:hypothetical protein